MDSKIEILSSLVDSPKVLKAFLAALTALSISSFVPEAMVPITFSVVGFSTSMSSDESGSTHSPLI